ncbi:acyltransferase family protein [Acinetobacter haemolyticus]|uniref:acyltransferase family protein n=1 Tax=Acinetobacter haemolyticus TaxID=29430 RepID=UPI000DE89226|nr:acyltransferase [Acinetobacter haemolyticus]WHR58400.1 acyltransferase [Acinetobacter haemolyticus]
MRLALLDYARFFAALSVVFFHYFYNGITNGKVTSIEKTWVADAASYGHFGVQFFFIISGYVIFFSIKNKSATSFMKSRLKRLYPTYWFAVLFTSFFAFMWAQGTDLAVTIKQVLINLTMLHKFVGVPSVDGVYWTLVYEIVFYAIVFLTLLFGNLKKVLGFLIAWPLLIIIANYFGKTFFIFDMYFLYFVIGAMFALLKNKGIKTSVALSVLALSVVAAYFQMYEAGIQKGNNILIVSGIYLAMLGFFTLLNIDKFRTISLPRAQDLGGMTYPLYLIHAHFGYMFLNRFATNENQTLVYALLLIIVMSLSWILWYVIEVKQANFWHKFFSFAIKPVKKIEAKLN